MNKELLRSVMALHGETNRDLANLLGISEQSVSAKINENGTEFKQGEIAMIRQHYNLTAEQVTNIFFA
jgi:predicted transcriptional regulator